MNPGDLDYLSRVALNSALAVYALGFIAFTLDLVFQQLPKKAGAAGSDKRYTSPALRVALALTVLAWLLHLGATILRGIAASRVPWANMYEFSLTGTLAMVTVFLFLTLVLRLNLRFLGTPLLALVLIILGVTLTNYYVPVSPLQPALQSYWLVIHILVALLAVGFFTMGALLSLVQLLQGGKSRRIKRVFEAWPHFPAGPRLELFAYLLNTVGFVFWTFTLVAGAIWAEKAWGRYWGWDVKEVWTFIIWVLYAGYIHARATVGWRGKRSAILSLVGFGAVIFNFSIVNIFFSGLHSYSGL